MDNVSTTSDVMARRASCDAMDGIGTNSSVRARAPSFCGGNAMDGVAMTSSARPRTSASCGGKAIEEVVTSSSVHPNECMLGEGIEHQVQHGLASNSIEDLNIPFVAHLDGGDISTIVAHGDGSVHGHDNTYGSMEDEIRDEVIKIYIINFIEYMIFCFFCSTTFINN